MMERRYILQKKMQQNLVILKIKKLKCFKNWEILTQKNK